MPERESLPSKIKRLLYRIIDKLIPKEIKYNIQRLEGIDKKIDLLHNKLDIVLSEARQAQIEVLSEARQAQIKVLSEARQARIKSEIILTYLAGFSGRDNERIVVNDYQYANPDLLNSYKIFAKSIRKGDKVLDCASGVGYGAAYLNDHTDAAVIIGGDINPNVVEFSKKIFGAPFSVLKENVVSFQWIDMIKTELFPENTFDKICSFETLEHIPNQIASKAFQNLYYWLKPGGVCYCSVPNNDIFPFPTSSSGYHFRHYTPEEFSNTLKGAGFSKVKIVFSNEKEELFSQWNACCYGVIIAICEK